MKAETKKTTPAEKKTTTAAEKKKPVADTIKKIVSSDCTNALGNAKIEARYLAMISVLGYQKTIEEILAETPTKFINSKGKHDRKTVEGNRLGDRISKINQLANGSNADGKKPDVPMVKPLPVEKAKIYGSFSTALSAREKIKRKMSDAELVEVAERHLAQMLKTLGSAAVEAALQNMKKAAS